MIFTTLLFLGQITKPPEFEEAGKFESSKSAGTVDGSSHVSAERAAVNKELLAALRPLRDYGEGIRLIENQMPSAAETYFRAKRQRLGVGVTLFLAGKVEASAELLCQLVGEKPAGLLAVLGETVGAAPAWSGRMLLAIRKLAQPETSAGEYYLARALLKQEPPLLEEARRHLARSAALDPRATAALLETARQTADRTEAIATLEEALRRDEQLSVAHYRLGQLYRAAGDLDRSRQHLLRFAALRGK